MRRFLAETESVLSSSPLQSVQSIDMPWRPPSPGVEISNANDEDAETVVNVMDNKEIQPEDESTTLNETTPSITLDLPQDLLDKREKVLGELMEDDLDFLEELMTFVDFYKPIDAGILYGASPKTTRYIVAYFGLVCGSVTCDEE
jgi:hypothetical protein